MPLQSLAALVDVSLLWDFALALTVVALLISGAAFAWYNFKAQKTKVRADVIKDWREVVEAQNAKLELLEEGLEQARKQHEADALKINAITAFNLRLQAREVRYQKTINELQGKSGLPITNFDTFELDAHTGLDFS